MATRRSARSYSPAARVNFAAMPGSRTLSATDRRPDRALGAAIFVATLSIFWLSPVRGTTDTRYSMLVSQSLVSHGSFSLDYYDVPRDTAGTIDGRASNGRAYQLETARGHAYYYFPPGGPALSAPFVAVMNRFGVSASNSDGTYSYAGEMTILGALAALLMATLTVIFYRTARLLLPAGWGALVSLGAALGTQVWSTASRVVWSDTWAILLLGVAVWILLAHETAKLSLRPMLLASLLAWSYFCRPTCSVPVAAVSLYLLVYYRRLFLPYAAAGAFWLSGFVLYSWHHFGTLLPAYYRADRLQFNNFGIALWGNLFSPSRGLLIYVPVVAFVAFLLLHYRKRLLFPRLVILSMAIIVVHLVVICGFDTWYGGGCYGPRYTTGIVPWLFLLAVMGVRAMLDARGGARAPSRHWRAQIAAGALLLALSVFVNARGALSRSTVEWNVWPRDVDQDPERVFDWRYPQLLAGLVLPPPPADLPFVAGETQIDFTSHDADKFLWHGWSAPETTQRWSEEREALLIFAEASPTDTLLRMSMGGYVGHGGITEQRVTVRLNGSLVAVYTLKEEAAREFVVTLPKHLLRQKNVLAFELPDAKSPSSIEHSPDGRLLGVRVEWMILKP